MNKLNLLSPLLFLSLFINSEDLFILGLGSCIDQDADQEKIWSSIKKEKIDEFFFLGDNVYGDSKDGNLIKMRSAYKTQIKSLPTWLDEVSINAIWDDHDYGVNDGGSDYPKKDEAQELFLDFWNISETDPRSTREGIYFSKEVDLNGIKIKVIGLDTRYFRSPLEGDKRNRTATKDKRKTILGKVQWKWLENELSKEADMIILASSIQVIANNHGFEKWGNFPHERTRLLELLNQTKKTVIIVSGDRHKAGIYNMDNLIEITSSSLNRPLPKWLATLWDSTKKETDEFLLGEMFYQTNYGIIKLSKDKKITIQLKDEDANILNETFLYL